MMSTDRETWNNHGYAVFDDIECLADWEGRPVTDTHPLGSWMASELDEGDRIAATCELEIKDWREQR